MQNRGTGKRKRKEGRKEGGWMEGRTDGRRGRRERGKEGRREGGVGRQAIRRIHGSMAEGVHLDEGLGLHPHVAVGRLWQCWIELVWRHLQNAPNNSFQLWVVPQVKTPVRGWSQWHRRPEAFATTDQMFQLFPERPSLAQPVFECFSKSDSKKKTHYIQQIFAIWSPSGGKLLR